MTLRDYQEQAIEAARGHVRAGRRRVLIVSPTGSGKTVLGAAIARQHVERGGRVVWLAHRAELCEQAARTLSDQAAVVGDDVDGKRDPDAPIQVCMIQTLLVRERPPATLVICDEAHHLAADEWKAVPDHYGDVPRIGLTATPERRDGRGLSGAFDALVVAATVRDLTARGHLVPCEIFRPSRELPSGHIAQSPLDAYRAHCDGRKTIIFAPRVDESVGFAAAFNQAGIQAEHIDGTTPVAVRRGILERFRTGQTRVLTNVYVLTEGFDDPGASACILARGCGSPGMYLQIAGRILRPAPGKTDAVLVDLRGVSHVHGKPEDERVYSLDGKGIRVAEDDDLRFCRVCGSSLEDYPCGSCGATLEVGEAAPSQVTGDKLEPYAAKRAEGYLARVETLSRWVLTGSRLGYKPGFAKVKFKAVYGVWPSEALVQDAQRMAFINRAASIPNPREEFSERVGKFQIFRRTDGKRVEYDETRPLGARTVRVLDD